MNMHSTPLDITTMIPSQSYKTVDLSNCANNPILGLGMYLVKNNIKPAGLIANTQQEQLIAEGMQFRRLIKQAGDYKIPVLGYALNQRTLDDLEEAFETTHTDDTLFHTLCLPGELHVPLLEALGYPVDENLRYLPVQSRKELQEIFGNIPHNQKTMPWTEFLVPLAQAELGMIGCSSQWENFGRTIRDETYAGQRQLALMVEAQSSNMLIPTQNIKKMK